MRAYVLDSNFFIQAHRSSYPLDVALSFWSKVRQLAESGTVISIDKVKKEIYDHQDSLKEWCENNLPEDFFKPTNEVVHLYGQVVTWANGMAGHYSPPAVAEFLNADEADAWLVAYALGDVSNRIIVTQEKSEPGRKNKIKIPEACVPFQVQYTDTVTMFRQIGARF